MKEFKNISLLKLPNGYAFDVEKKKYMYRPPLACILAN